jgi:dipeptidyl aminopeptidase/acylaminoacyl peptidase
VYPHGGPTTLHDAGWYPWLQYFVQKGYAVLAPNFRGSTGYGRAFELANKGEWGKKDLDDVVAGAAYLSGLPWIDPRRIAIQGASYGGYQVLLALSKAPGVFACGVDFFGVANRFSSWRDTDRIGKRNMERKLGKPTENRELYREASPLFYAAQVNVPLMLMHGQDDKRVPFGQSVEMVEELKRLGIPVEFHAYPGEGHGFQQPKHLEDIYHKVERFFALYL